MDEPHDLGTQALSAALADAERDLAEVLQVQRADPDAVVDGEPVADRVARYQQWVDAIRSGLEGDD